MLRAGARQSSRLDLAALGDARNEQPDFLVVDELDLVDAETTDSLAPEHAAPRPVGFRFASARASAPHSFTSGVCAAASVDAEVPGNDANGKAFTDGASESEDPIADVEAEIVEAEASADPIEAGQVYEYTIDLWATSNLFWKGHRIRLEISSSNFPRFDRNANTGGPIGEDRTVVSALQTIHHDSTFPSHVTLPIVPRD